jgi:hypothetical protein
MARTSNSDKHKLFVRVGSELKKQLENYMESYGGTQDSILAISLAEFLNKFKK